MQVLNIIDNVFDGTQHPPGGRIVLGDYRVGEGVAQLGHHADAESRLLVPGHIKLIQKRGFGKLRVSQSLPHDRAGIIPVNQAGHVVIGLTAFHGVGQLGKALAPIPGHSQVESQIIETCLWKQAETRTPTHDGSFSDGAHHVNDLFSARQRPLRVHVADVVQVPEGDADKIGLELPNRSLGFLEKVLGKHQVQYLDVVPVRVQISGDVSQPYRGRIGVHTAHQSLVPVCGDQQDSHIQSILGEINFPMALGYPLSSEVFYPSCHGL